MYCSASAPMLPYSQEVLTSVGHARMHAAKQGSIFVTTDHLVLGILSTACSAATLIHQVNPGASKSRSYYSHNQYQAAPA